MIRVPCCLVAGFCLAIAAAEPAPSSAQEPPAAPAPVAQEPPAAPVQPAFVQLDASRFKLGEVEFNRETRAITFPAAVNMNKGLLEYVIVHDNGKVHESLLRTKINPAHLNVALKLLRYQASEELFPLMDEEGHPSGLFPQVDAKTRAAARVEIRVIWKAGETERSAPINEWIVNTKNDQPMPPGPWVYGGSVVYEGRFIAEATGDIVAILTNRVSIFNYPGANNQDQENYGDWFSLTNVVPAVGTPVTVEIRPWQTPAKSPPAR